MALEAKTEVTELFEYQVVGLVTDNEKNAAHESDKNLTVYGCSSHWLNLKVFH